MTAKDEEAVSPVIGVILMVAMVVILAAVITAFIFGMAGTSPDRGLPGKEIKIEEICYEPPSDFWDLGTYIYTAEDGEHYWLYPCHPFMESCLARGERYSILYNPETCEILEYHHIQTPKCEKCLCGNESRTPG